MSKTHDWFRPYRVSSGRCKKTVNNENAEKEQIRHGMQKKNPIQNNMIQQHLYHGDLN